MKSYLLIILFLFFTAGSIVVPYKAVSSANTPKQIEVGPNQTYFWTSGHIVSNSLEDTFSLKSYRHFELHQGTIVKPATLEAPEPGEDQGLYWVRDFPMSGTWSISSPATIFSLETSTFISTPNFFEKGWNILIGSVLGFVFWILSVGFVAWLDKVIPD